MALVRIIYIVLLAITGMFFILYLDSLSLILFLVVAFLPVLFFLLTLLSKLLTSVDISIDKSVVTKGSDAVLNIIVQNKSFIALPSAKLFISTVNDYLGESEKKEISVSTHALSKQTIHFAIGSKHIGNVRVIVDELALYDYFRLFHFKVKVNKEVQISFLPEMLPVSVRLRPNNYLSTDSDVFSKAKSGDDPSEVFAIRDYVGGDKLNRIHWKLSSKQDNLMVKEYSLPINNSIMLLLELNADKKSDNYLTYLDTVIESIICISTFFADHSMNHFVAWYDADSGRFYNEEIKGREDVYSCLGAILSSQTYSGTAALEFYRGLTTSYSHVIYASPLINDEILTEIRQFGYTTFYSVLQAVLDDKEAIKNVAGIQLMPVKSDNVALSLCDAVL